MALYRNGASSNELLEVIGEKNTEINELKADLSGKTDKLKKLAKSSGDVMSQYRALQDAFNKLKVEHNDSIELIKSRAIEIENLKLNYAELMKNYEVSVTEYTTKQNRIVSMERDLIEANVTIEKLQQRVAVLVAEKTEKSKQLDRMLIEKGDVEKKLQVTSLLLS